MMLILKLPDDQECVLKAKAQSQGLSPEEILAANSPRRRIAERIAEIMADVPTEKVAKLPKGAR